MTRVEVFNLRLLSVLIGFDRVFHLRHADGDVVTNRGVGEVASTRGARSFALDSSRREKYIKRVTRTQCHKIHCVASAQASECRGVM